MPGSTLFTDAMALTPDGDGVYHGELNEHWTIGPEGARRRDAGAVRQRRPHSSIPEGRSEATREIGQAARNRSR